MSAQSIFATGPCNVFVDVNDANDNFLNEFDLGALNAGDTATFIDPNSGSTATVAVDADGNVSLSIPQPIFVYDTTLIVVPTAALDGASTVWMEGFFSPTAGAIANNPFASVLLTATGATTPLTENPSRDGTWSPDPWPAIAPAVSTLSDSLSYQFYSGAAPSEAAFPEKLASFRPMVNVPEPPPPSTRIVELRTSKDGGHNFGYWRQYDMGPQGRFNNQPVFRRLGLGRRIVMHVRTSADCNRDVVACSVDTEPF